MSHLAVIPSLSALGPMALLALIAPAAFAALMLWMKRWTAALGAASAMSTAYLLQGWWQGPLRPTWLSTRSGFWAVLALVGVFFCSWAVRRLRRGDSGDSGKSTRADVFVFSLAAILTGYSCVRLLIDSRSMESVGITMLVAFAAVAAGLIALLMRGPAELTFVTVLVLGCAAASVFELGRSIVSPTFRVDWGFEPERAGAFLNSPCVTEDRIYIGAAHRDGFQQSGEVYVLGRSTGRPEWSWSDQSQLRPIFGTPCYFELKLLVGEGLHADSNCKLSCLNSTSGEKIWEFVTKGHVESSPLVSDGRVYFGAGDDGLYCLEVESGKSIWHFENLHIDASPVVHNGVVYVGSYWADDSRHKDLRLIALSAATGELIWSVPVDVSTYQKPAIGGEFVYFSVGAGNYESSGPKPAGAVIVLEAATGRQAWRTDLPDSVFGTPLLIEDSLVVGCRNGSVYSLDRKDGRIQWERPIGSAILGSLAYHSGGHDDTVVIAVGMSGRCVKLAMRDGRMIADIDLVRAASGTSGLFTAAPVVRYELLIGRRTFVAGAITRGLRETPVLFCLTDGN
jgi:outer membrane protein assembly factor BamB